VSDVSTCKCGASLIADTSGTRCAARCPYDSERRAFIREHASRLDAAVCAASASGARQDQQGSILPAARVWELARELWNDKPEDC